jgi:PKD repeat protein
MGWRVSLGNKNFVKRGTTLALAAALTLCPFAENVALAGAPAAAAAAGAISIASDPSGASVYVDGQFVGETPLDVRQIAPGDHRVRVVKDGYLENGRVVNIAAGKTGTVAVRLTGKSAKEAARQAGGGGVSTTNEGSNKKKWIIIGAAAGGGAIAAYALTRTPTPSFSSQPSANPTGGLPGLTTITFTATASGGNGLSYTWDFGDGTTGTGQSQTHKYVTAGTFTVKCTAKNDGGKSADATTSVNIRSFAGAWNLAVTGAIANLNAVLTLTQSGSSVGGTYSDVFGAGTVTSGSVTQSGVTVAVTQPGFAPFTFVATSGSSDGNTFTGTITNFFGAGTAPAFTATRR